MMSDNNFTHPKMDVERVNEIKKPVFGLVNCLF